MTLGMNKTRSAGYIAIDGNHLVPQEMVQVVEAIRAYDPNIHVQWIPARARRHGQAAFKITHEEPGKPPYIIMHVQNDEDMTPKVLQQIIAGDARWGNNALKEVEAAEATAHLMAEQKWQDYLEEQADIVKSIINSPLNKYTVNKDLVIQDGVPFNAKKLKD